MIQAREGPHCLAVPVTPARNNASHSSRTSVKKASRAFIEECSSQHTTRIAPLYTQREESTICHMAEKFAMALNTLHSIMCDFAGTL